VPQFLSRKKCDFVWFDRNIDRESQCRLKITFFFCVCFGRFRLSAKLVFRFCFVFFSLGKRIILWIVLFLPGLRSSFKLPTAVIARIRSSIDKQQWFERRVKRKFCRYFQNNNRISTTIDTNVPAPNTFKAKMLALCGNDDGESLCPLPCRDKNNTFVVGITQNNFKHMYHLHINIITKQNKSLKKYVETLPESHLVLA
jgi:hypothetical protein